MQLFVNHLRLDANSENNVKKRKDSSVSNVPTYCQKKPKSSYSINIYASILIYFDMCFFFCFFFIITGSGDEMEESGLFLWR